MADLLTPDDLTAVLSSLDGWSGDTSRITRTATLPSFPAAIAVVDRVAVAAEELNHHPDIDIRWRTVTFVLSTHSAGGVTALDVTLARQINNILAAS
jgi:4a-hydroxytetrahydrobiopterin dehydratase